MSSHLGSLFSFIAAALCCVALNPHRSSSLLPCFVTLAEQDGTHRHRASFDDLPFFCCLSLLSLSVGFLRTPRVVTCSLPFQLACFFFHPPPFPSTLPVTLSYEPESPASAVDASAPPPPSAATPTAALIESNALHAKRIHALLDDADGDDNDDDDDFVSPPLKKAAVGACNGVGGVVV